MNALPANARALIQRIGRAGGAARLDNDLRPLAQVDHAIGVLAEEQAAVHGRALRAALAGIDHGVCLGGDVLTHRHAARGVRSDLHALAAHEHEAPSQRIHCNRTACKANRLAAFHLRADLQRAAVGREIFTAVDLRLRRLDEAHTVQLADLAREQLARRGILVRGDPRLILAQVERHARMDDADILAVEGRRVHLLQMRRGLRHQLARQTAVRRQIIAVLHLGLGTACAQLRCVDHLIALLNLVARHRVERQPHVRAVAVGDLQHHVVNGRQIQHIGHGRVVAVLRQLLRDVAHGDAAAIRGHALGQRRECLVERAELAPLHRLASAHGHPLRRRELVVYELGLRALEQLHPVIRLHLRAQIIACLRVRLREQLQVIHMIDFHSFPLSSCPFSVRTAQNRIFSPPCTRLRMSASSSLESFRGSGRETQLLPPRFSRTRRPPLAMLRAACPAARSAA